MYEVGITGTVACQYPRLGSRFTVYISEKPNTKKEYRPIAKSTGIFWQKFHLHTILSQWIAHKHLYVKFFFQCSRRPSRCMQMIIKPIPPHMIYRRGLKGTCLRTTQF
uniref:Uncharacterized protein n=1 Tax=Strongyloides papillosus TaxID=174720 RepID=A0A0N5BCR3_STREA